MKPPYYILPFLYLWSASASSVFNGLEKHNESPRFINTKDSRTDGISYEINRELVTEHLKATLHTYTFEGQHGSSLEDLTKPGLQHLQLTYWNGWACSRTDYFLHVLQETEISEDSKWIIRARGMWGYQGNMTLLADVIQTLPAIAELHWDTMWLIPAIVLHALEEKHPDCRLYYNMPMKTFSNNDMSQDLPFNTDSTGTAQNILRVAEIQQILEDTTFQSILGSKNLYSLKARIDHSLMYPAEKLDLVHRILLSCPNIRELDLRIDIDPCVDMSDPAKCCEFPSRYAVLAFDFTKHDGMFPPLEVLKLEGYRFDYGLDGTYVEQEVNMPYNIANLKAWKTHMDWSHVHSFHLSNPLVTELMLFREMMPNLRHFGVDGGDIYHVRPRIKKYLAKLSPLESLALQEAELRPLDDLLDIIQNNHTTLRSFKLNHQQDGPRRSTRRDGTFWPNRFEYSEHELLSNTQLDRLFEICPDLYSLDLDVPTDFSWNYEFFDKILLFPQVRELTLRFPPEKAAQLYDGIQYRISLVEQPELRIAMRGVRNYLRKRKVGEPFVVLRTFLGYIEFGDGEEERQPSYMV